MEEKEAAYKLGDRYISIQKTEGGYDYSIFDAGYGLLDGGVYDNEDISIQDVLRTITDELKEPVYDARNDTYSRSILQGNIRQTDEPEPIYYEELMEKADKVGQAEIIQAKSAQETIADFRAATERQFRPERLDGTRIEDIEDQVREMVQEAIDTYGLDARIDEVILTGSRSRGLDNEDSDIDVVVSYTGTEPEADLFNIMHEEIRLIAGVPIDINPINPEQTGTLADYLIGAERFLTVKMMERDLSFREPAMELLGKYGYELVAEQGEGQDLTLIRMPGDSDSYGFDGWEMIADYFKDVNELVENHDLKTLRTRLEGDNSRIPFGIADEQLRAAIRYKEEHMLVRSASENERDTGQERKPKQIVTFTVAESSEFHSFGELHEGIPTLQDAIKLYEKMKEEKSASIPALGINIHTQGTSRNEDIQCDVLYGGRIDLEGLKYIPEMSQNAEAAEALHELAESYPDIEVSGRFPDEPDVKLTAEGLAREIDAFAYEHDTYEYKDVVDDREANIRGIAASIEARQDAGARVFLNSYIQESDDKETVAQAKELLKKLNEYKPLAKVEELVEQNYNMIDNVINNQAPAKEEKQEPKEPEYEEHTSFEGRVSMKDLLAEKMAIVAAREKKSKEADKAKKHEPCLSSDQ